MRMSNISTEAKIGYQNDKVQIMTATIMKAKPLYEMAIKYSTIRMEQKPLLNFRSNKFIYTYNKPMYN